MSQSDAQLANLQPAPPAPEGNLRAATHGAQSERLVAPLAERLVADVLAANRHLDAQRDGPAIVRYARVQARIAHVEAWLAERSDPVFADREEGVEHGILTRLERWEAAAERVERALAISPLTRTQLGLARAAAIDAALALSEPDPQLRRELMVAAGILSAGAGEEDQ